MPSSPPTKSLLCPVSPQFNFFFPHVPLWAPTDARDVLCDTKVPTRTRGGSSSSLLRAEESWGTCTPLVGARPLPLTPLGPAVVRRGLSSSDSMAGAIVIAICVCTLWDAAAGRVRTRSPAPLLRLLVAPRVVGVRFPARRKSIKTYGRKSGGRAAALKQQTLTQIDYLVSTPPLPHEDDDALPEPVEETENEPLEACT